MGVVPESVGRRVLKDCEAELGCRVRVRMKTGPTEGGDGEKKWGLIYTIGLSA